MFYGGGVEKAMSTSTKQLPLFQAAVLEEYEKGKDELTLAEFPLALAGKAPSKKGNTSVTYRDVIKDKSNGEPVTRTITIQGSDRFGLPTYYDEEVLFGILQLTNVQRDRAGAWPKEVRFSRYHLAKILGLKTDGRTYRRMWDSLHRLANTTYNFEYAFFDKADEEWRPAVVITFIQTLIVHGGHIPGKNGDCTVRWNEDIHRNFQAGYLRNINFAEYRAIGLPLAKALFRFLGKRFYFSRYQHFDLHTLAYEKLGLSRSYNTGQIKRALAPAIERLEGRGFIKAASRAERYRKIKAGSWQVYFEKCTDQESFPLPVPQKTKLQSALIEEGITESTALKLSSQYPEEVLERKLDELRYLMLKGKAPTENPAGWLVTSIRENWESPSGYMTPEELDREFKAKEEEQKAKRESALAKRHKELEFQRIKEQRERGIEAYLISLSEEEQDRLTQDAMGPEPSEIQILMKGTTLRIHIGRILEEQGKIPPTPIQEE